MPQRKELSANARKALVASYNRHVSAYERVGCEPEPFQRFVDEFEYSDYTQMQADDYTADNVREGLVETRYRAYEPPRGER